MPRPENQYTKHLLEYQERANPTLEAAVILKALADAFEEGVDAGMKAKDEEWRGKIQEMLQNTPTDYHHRVEAIPVHLVEELLSGRDIE